MNFLAHAWLADPDPALMAGGVLGDWIKGPLDGAAAIALPSAIRDGVRLHRAIDAFAETHPAFCRSRTRISTARRRYAGVLVDIFYDHILARDWTQWHAAPLHEFTHAVYETLTGVTGLSLPAHDALNRMAAEDWLSQYPEPEGIRRILVRMSQRARQPNPLANSFDEYALGNRDGFDADAAEFLRDARDFVAAGFRRAH